jgi:uncharacterized protein YoxC
MMLEAERMTEQKTASRKAPLILGIVGTMLAVGLVVALVVYLPLSGTINSLNAQIGEKNQTIASLNLQITTLQNQISSLTTTSTNAEVLQTQVKNLQLEIQSLNNILNMNVSAILVEKQPFLQELTTNLTIWGQENQPLVYAGYVTVEIESSSDMMYVELSYTSYGVVYDNVVTMGNGTAVFPVLPGYVFIVVGNNEATADTVTGTMAATYHY